MTKKWKNITTLLGEDWLHWSYWLYERGSQVCMNVVPFEP